MPDQATKLRSLVRSESDRDRGRRTGVIAVAGGKGGVGGSIVALNLAVAYAESGREVVLAETNRARGALELLAGSPDPHPRLRIVATDTLPAALREWSAPAQPRGTRRPADIVVVDAGTGLGPDAVDAAMAADVLLVVTSTEVTSILGAYSLLKEVARAGGRAELRCVVNGAPSPREAEAAAAGLNTAAVHFLHRSVEYVGTIPADEAVRASVTAQRPLLLHDGVSGAALSVRALALRLLREIHAVRSRRIIAQ